MTVDPEFKHVYSKPSTKSETKGIMKLGKRKMSFTSVANDEAVDTGEGPSGEGPSSQGPSCEDPSGESPNNEGLWSGEGPGGDHMGLSLLKKSRSLEYHDSESSESMENSESPEAKKNVHFLNDDEDDECLKDNLPGFPLKSSQRELVREFFCQLLGSVLGMEYYIQPQSHSPLFGIGVVGFKVSLPHTQHFHISIGFFKNFFNDIFLELKMQEEDIYFHV